jgi:hypothetical protein
MAKNGPRICACCTSLAKQEKAACKKRGRRKTEEERDGLQSTALRGAEKAR